MSANLEQSIINELLSAWGLNLIDYITVGDAYKVFTNQGIFCLKDSEKTPNQTRFILGLMQHVRDKGFKLCPEIRPTKEGRLYISADNKSYYLTNWLEGERPNFCGRENDIVQTGQTLAYFHKTAKRVEYFLWEGIKFRYGYLAENIKQSMKKMEVWLSQLEDKSDPLAGLYRTYYAWTQQKNQEALQCLDRADYMELSNQAQRQRTVIHGDVAARNFLMSPLGGAWLIDFDSCRYDLQLTDLAKLMRRVLKRNDWQFSYAHLLLNAYTSLIGLDKKQMSFILAYLLYQKRFFQLSRRYIRKKDGSASTRLYRKMKRVIKSTEVLDQFYREFQEKLVNRI